MPGDARPSSGRSSQIRERSGLQWRLVLATGLLLLVPGTLVVPPITAWAQFTECPFTEALAEPDSLDPGGYLPLEVGNAWEHLVWSVCCLEHAVRREVVADTVVGDQTYHVVSETRTWFIPGQADPLDSTSVSDRETTRHYMAVQDDWLVEWVPEDGPKQRIKLGADFQSCYADPRSGALAVVWELPAASFDLKKTLHPDDPEPPPGKAVDVEGEQFFYQYGVGYVSGSHADTAVVLTYANVGGLHFGDPMDHLFVSVEEPSELPIPGTLELAAYPNPFSVRARFELNVPQAAQTTVRVVDLLGRTVAHLMREKQLEPGRHTMDWEAQGLSSGLYFVQVFHAGRLILTESIILAR